MPTANYRCRDCGKQLTYTTTAYETLPQEIDVEHGTSVRTVIAGNKFVTCKGKADRVWGGKENAPAIGAVKGAGGSPARG